jgi:hypothetical protein
MRSPHAAITFGTFSLPLYWLLLELGGALECNELLEPGLELAADDILLLQPCEEPL